MLKLEKSVMSVAALFFGSAGGFWCSCFFMCLALLGCSAAADDKSAVTKITAKITLSPERMGAAVNRGVLGNNIQWVDHADGLQAPGSGNFVAGTLAYAKAMGSTVLRYPGGAQADVYRWQDGMGEWLKRGENQHFFNKKRQKVTFGTREFLEYCEAVNAIPLITVNTATGTPEEAADWVKLVNSTRLTSEKTGKQLPKVRYWEIGNEPYVNDAQRKELWITPASFAAKANLFIRAMKKIDPSIEVGIPLRSDKIGTVPATPHQGFNRKVLTGIDAPFEFVALHNAYLPFNYDPDKSYNQESYFLATMAASRVITEDFSQTRALLRELKPGKDIALAVTEFNALYIISERPEAKYISSLAGALYVADALRLFAATPDLLFANFWSLSGNWHFGALDNAGRPRPAYYVLKIFNEFLHGRLIDLNIVTPTFSSPRVGVVPAYKDTPLVTGLATRDGKFVRLLLINKDPAALVNASLSIADDPNIAEINFRYLTGTKIFASGEASEIISEHTESLAVGPSVSFKLRPRSVGIITIKLK